MLQLELNNGSMGSELPPLQALTPWEQHQAVAALPGHDRSPKPKSCFSRSRPTCVFLAELSFFGDGSWKSVNGRRDSAGFTD